MASVTFMSKWIISLDAVGYFDQNYDPNNRALWEYLSLLDAVITQSYCREPF